MIIICGLELTVHIQPCVYEHIHNCAHWQSVKYVVLTYIYFIFNLIGLETFPGPTPVACMDSHVLPFLQFPPTVQNMRWVGDWVSCVGLVFQPLPQ